MTIGQLKMKMGSFLALVPHSEDSTFQARIMTRKPSFEPNCKLELGDIVDVLQLNTVKPSFFSSFLIINHFSLFGKRQFLLIQIQPNSNSIS